jgi:hypothetical protein
VFSFSTSSYRSAKITASIVSQNSFITQINEVLLAHNTTDAYLTVYGGVTSPASSNLGSFTTTINTGVVYLQFLQKYANSNVTITANLIK